MSLEKEIRDAEKNTEYNKGVEDAMQTINLLYVSKKDGGYKEDLLGIFGTDSVHQILKFSPQDIMAKIEAWDKNREKRIDVGDIFSCGCDGELTMLVTKVNYKEKLYEGISKDGGTYTYPMNSRYIFKKDKHIDIVNLLDQIEG